MGATGNLASSILVSCRQTMSGSFAASQSISRASRTFSEFTFQLASFMVGSLFVDHRWRAGTAGRRDDDFLARCNHPFDLDDCDSWLRAAKEQTLRRELNGAASASGITPKAALAGYNDWKGRTVSLATTSNTDAQANAMTIGFEKWMLFLSASIAVG